MARLQDTMMRGTRALQPLPTACATGSVYCVTDELFIQEQNDGAAWNPYCPVPGAGSTPGEVTMLTADPGAPVDDTIWFKRSASSPYTITLCVRIAGVTTEVPLAVVP